MSKCSSSIRSGASIGASLITSHATTVRTPSRVAASASGSVPTLLQTAPSRKTVSAPTSKSDARASACSASASSTSSTSSPEERRSSANARPSSNGAETVQKTRSGGVCRTASRTVADAEWVRTNASVSDGASWIAIAAAARSRPSMRPRTSSSTRRRSSSGARWAPWCAAASTRPTAPAIAPIARRLAASSRPAASRRSSSSCEDSAGSPASSASASTARRAIQLPP